MIHISKSQRDERKCKEVDGRPEISDGVDLQGEGDGETEGLPAEGDEEGDGEVVLVEHVDCHLVRSLGRCDLG